MASYLAREVMAEVARDVFAEMNDKITGVCEKRLWVLGFLVTAGLLVPFVLYFLLDDTVATRIAPEMNHSDHAHHDHGHHKHQHESHDDDSSVTKQLINATLDLIASTMSPPVMNHDAHAHHDHHHLPDAATTDANWPAAAPDVAHHAGHGAHGAHGAEGHWMKMWFHCGYEEVILFDFWRIDTLTGLLLSCVGIFIMAALYEGLKWFRVHLQTVFESRQMAQVKNRTANGAPLLGNNIENGRPAYRGSNDVYAPTTSESDVVVQTPRQSLFSPLHLLQSLLYVAQLTLAYWLMLIVMTYNVYLTAA
uniref:Copper transport protein n=1 Tax=Plectus sambesii TaxID=2011161 RepID=A0A914XBK9_9BILA